MLLWPLPSSLRNSSSWVHSETSPPWEDKRCVEMAGPHKSFQSSAQQCHRSLPIHAIGQSKLHSQAWHPWDRKYNPCTGMKSKPWNILTPTQSVIVFQVNYKNYLKFLTYILCTAPNAILNVTSSFWQITILFLLRYGYKLIRLTSST